MSTPRFELHEAMRAYMDADRSNEEEAWRKVLSARRRLLNHRRKHGRRVAHEYPPLANGQA